MLDLSRVVLLQPRSRRAYGQDFLGAQMNTASQFEVVSKVNGVYPIDQIDEGDIVVGQNPDDTEESRVLHELSQKNKIVVFVHCQWEYYDDRQRKNVAHALENATIVITPARFSTERLRRLFQKIPYWRTIDGCVDPELFHPSTRAERDEFRREHRLAGEDKLVLFTGRLEPAKGTTILKDLCATLGRHFAIMVQYPDSDNVRERPALFQSYQDIRGIVEHHPKVAMFPDRDQRGPPRPVCFADIVVSPSLSEVQPLVLLEALAAGVPYVGTDSTPEYADLQARFSDCAPLADAIEIIGLPEGFRQGAVLRKTDINPADSKIIANRLAETLNRKAVPDDDARAALSEEFLTRGFTIPARIQNFRQALEGALFEERLS